jgi:tetratricopeptide (TPR) repeat protein
MFGDWNWAVARDEFARAIELDPRCVEAYLFHAQYLGWVLGDGNRAVSVLRKALEIDPLSVTVMAQLGAQLTNAGRPEEGLAEVERTLELAPNLVNAHWYRSLACRRLGRFEEAIGWLKETIPITGNPLHLVGELALSYAQSGRFTEAKSILEEGELGVAQPYYVALVLAAVGETDTAFEWVERAYEDRDQLLAAIRSTWDLAWDRDDRRFQAVVRKMNLPKGDGDRWT